jgi:hypothetical protein
MTCLITEVDLTEIDLIEIGLTTPVIVGQGRCSCCGSPFPAGHSHRNCAGCGTQDDDDADPPPPPKNK